MNLHGISFKGSLSHEIFLTRHEIFQISLDSNNEFRKNSRGEFRKYQLPIISESTRYKLQRFRVTRNFEIKTKKKRKRNHYTLVSRYGKNIRLMKKFSMDLFWWRNRCVNSKYVPWNTFGPRHRIRALSWHEIR